jgi:very-short-patch-repair endonuclease
LLIPQEPSKNQKNDEKHSKIRHAMKKDILISIINSQEDFRILCEQSWYRIPVSSVEKWLKHRWPPQWIAFYQTKVFKEKAYSVHHYAKVRNIREVHRRDLFPDEPPNPKQNKTYYQLLLEPLQTLPQPIVEINDLYDESPLEDRLWAEFKRLRIHAERQELVKVNDVNYFLDFAVYCTAGNLDVEADGDTWHVGKEKARADNLRDNALKTAGWQILRFNTQQIKEQTTDYCVSTVVKNINRLGGLNHAHISKNIFNEKLGKMELF